MTTIAFDGRFLAADRRVMHSNEIIARACRKLDVAGDPAMAFASTGMIIEEWRAALIGWWLAGHAPGDLPPFGGDIKDAGSFVVIEPDGAVWNATYVCPYPWRDAPPCAWGTGADFATGAMLAGKSAMEAVAIAAQRDANTGGGMQFIDITEMAAGVQDWTAARLVARRASRRKEKLAA